MPRCLPFPQRAGAGLRGVLLGTVLLVVLSACTGVAVDPTAPTSPGVPSSAPAGGDQPSPAPAPPSRRQIVSMTVREWQDVHAVLDETANVASVNGPRSDVVLGSALRSSIRSQVGRRGAWPPGREVAAVVLSVESWRFVADQLQRWAAWRDGTSRPDGAAQLRRLRELVLRRLA